MQTELFEWASRPVQEKQPVPKASFLDGASFTLRLDHALGIALVLLVFYVLVFVWGVERGRRATLESYASQMMTSPVSKEITETPVAPVVERPSETAAAVFPADAVPQEVPIPVSELPVPVAAVSTPKGKYTIQHVTYIAKSDADREIAKFFKKGHAPFVIPSGRYLQVCVDAFETRQEASKILRRLRAEGVVTSDAYVRPIQR